MSAFKILSCCNFKLLQRFNFVNTDLNLEMNLNNRNWKHIKSQIKLIIILKTAILNHAYFIKSENGYGDVEAGLCQNLKSTCLTAALNLNMLI